MEALLPFPWTIKGSTAVATLPRGHNGPYSSAAARLWLLEQQLLRQVGSVFAREGIAKSMILCPSCRGTVSPHTREYSGTVAKPRRKPFCGRQVGGWVKARSRQAGHAGSPVSVSCQAEPPRGEVPALGKEASGDV